MQRVLIIGAAVGACALLLVRVAGAAAAGDARGRADVRISFALFVVDEDDLSEMVAAGAVGA